MTFFDSEPDFPLADGRSVLEAPAGTLELCNTFFGTEFIPGGHQSAVGQFRRRGIAHIRRRTVIGYDDGFGPGFPFVGADPAAAAAEGFPP